MICPSCADQMQVVGFEHPIRFADKPICKARAYLVCLKCALYQMMELEEANAPLL